MSRRKQALAYRLEADMNGGATKYLGYRVDCDWKRIEVPHAALLTEMAKAAGESGHADLLNYIPTPHEPDRTFSWAMNRVQVSHHVRFKVVKRKRGDFVSVSPHTVVAKRKAGATDEHHDRVAKTRVLPGIALRYSDEKIVAEDPGDAVAQAVATQFSYLRERVHTDDVRGMVTRILRYKLGGVSMSEQGRAWFVPFSLQAQAILPLLQRAVRASGSEADMYLLRLPKTEADAKRQAQKGAQASFENEYRKLRHQVFGFVERIFDGDMMKGSALKTRIDRARFLKNKAALYRDILELRTEEIEKASGILREATSILMDGAAEYRASMQDAKKCKTEADRKKAEKAAQADLEKYAAEARKLVASADEEHAVENGDDDEDSAEGMEE